MAFRGRLFSLRLHGGSAVASSRLRATQAHLGQKERKEFLEERVFLALEETKGFGLGIKRRNCARTTATFSTVAWVQWWSGIHNMSEAWKRENLKAAEESKVRSIWKTSIFFFFLVFEVLHLQSVLRNTSSCLHETEFSLH